MGVWAIKFAGTFTPELLVGYVQDRANELALQITMSILDKERIAHCHLCPQRFGLRKQAGHWVCSIHQTQEARAAVAA